MKRPHRLFLTFVWIVFATAIFIFGPIVIHKIYAYTTPESVMIAQRKEYSRLEKAEDTLTGADKVKIQKDRYKLYLWFNARGFPIDEGDGCDNRVHFGEPWRNLLDYWRDDDGSRFFTNQIQA
jgi:hypothetical protein